MSTFALLGLILTVTAILAWFNARVLRLPATIGMMAAALCLSLALVLLGRMGLVVDRWAEQLFLQIDFSAVLMKGMLSFLLFAGALHVDLAALLDRKWTILLLATFGVVVSTGLVGAATWLIAGALGLELPFIYALLFGALISPTDPIAVLGILKKAGAPESLELRIVGESLFNDGVGVVVFTIVLGIAAGGHEPSLLWVGELFLVEAVGGAVIGLVLGFVAYRMLRSIDDYAVEALITLALVAGGYALAGAVHASGPIAMVVAGLFIGNHGRLFGMSDRTRRNLDTFWELIDEVLNGVLFVMIGFEVLVLEIGGRSVLLGLIAIPLVLLVRGFSIGLPISLLRRWLPFDPHTIKLMTWAGLRGGISIALALAIPPSPYREQILVATYLVVVFSILVQGLSVGRTVRWAAARG